MKVNSISRALFELGEMPNDADAESVSAAVLCTLAERLSAGEAQNLADALPEELARRVAPCATDRQEAPPRFGRDTFLERVSARTGVVPTVAERLALAVMTGVKEMLPPKYVRDIADQLPQDLKELWHPPEAGPLPAPGAGRRGERAEIPSDHPLLRAIDGSGSLPEGLSALTAASSVLCVLAQRLTRGQAEDMLLSLPAGVRDIAADCGLHSHESGAKFGWDEFRLRVARHLGIDESEARRVVRLVFAALHRALPESEEAGIASQLPADLRALWNETTGWAGEMRP